MLWDLQQIPRKRLQISKRDTQALVHTYLEEKQWSKAAEAARRHIALDPWREVAHRQLTRALAEGGDRGGALTQFERCRVVLANELGVEPGEETRVLYERILAHDLTPMTHDTPSPRTSAPHSFGAGAWEPNSYLQLCAFPVTQVLDNGKPLHIFQSP